MKNKIKLNIQKFAGSSINFNISDSYNTISDSKGNLRGSEMILTVETSSSETIANIIKYLNIYETNKEGERVDRTSEWFKTQDSIRKIFTNSNIIKIDCEFPSSAPYIGSYSLDISLPNFSNLRLRKIKKVSNTAILSGNVVDSLDGDSKVNAPSIRAVKNYISSQSSGSGGSSLGNKKICVLGDSLSYGYGAEKSWATMLQERTNCTMVNLAISGAGLTSYCDNLVSDQIENIPSDADIIVLFCGGNDFWFSAPLLEYESALKSFIENITDLHPTKEVLYVSMPDVLIEGTAHSDITKYIDSTLKICFEHSIPCLNLFSAMGTSPVYAAQREAYYADNVHFNTAGQERLSKILQKFIENPIVNNSYNFWENRKPVEGTIVYGIGTVFDRMFKSSVSESDHIISRQRPNFTFSAEAGVWNLTTGDLYESDASAITTGMQFSIPANATLSLDFDYTVENYTGSVVNLWFACEDEIYYDMTDYQPNLSNHSCVVLSQETGSKSMYLENKTGESISFCGLMTFLNGDITNFKIKVKKLQITKEDREEEKYSTDEVRTNKIWIDGKPIYRKIYQINATSGTQSIIDISSLNVDLCWVNTSHSFLKTSTSNPEFKTLNYFEATQGYYIYAKIDSAPYKIIVNYTDSPYYHGTVYIEINYTKTTDIAEGS